MNSNIQKDKRFLKTKEICIFALLGAIMYCSKAVMEFLPNIHIVGALIVAYTLVYRSKALIPLYVYVFLCGLFGGFSAWWVAYLYVWLLLWAATMLLPRKSGKFSFLLYSLVCTLHGLSFGILYAPSQALFFGLDWKGTISWIVAGLPWDLVHGGGNLVASFLIVPIAALLKKINLLSFR